MFTGIIEAQGKLIASQPKNGDVTLKLQSQQLDFSDVALGDSIAVNGVCLTVTEFGGDYFCADVSRETLRLTTLGNLSSGSLVNLEKAMQPSSRFGGHMVSGHVDGLGKVVTLSRDARSLHIEVEAPAELARYIARKGSITVDGISLTVNAVDGCVFSLNIIPHTAEVTTIGQWQTGSRVNLEVDVVARYLERLLQAEPEKGEDSKKSGIDRAFLAQHGFSS